jgi:SpoVK/Ycf46/Vps4 family AAA+-type ATPase
VRQLANRLIRSVPPEVEDPEAFRAAVREAIVAGPSAGLRFGAGEVPVEHGTSDPLVTIESAPSAVGLTLPSPQMEQLLEVVEERHRSDELFSAGVSPTRTLLLSGPPGVGKSMAARWLAEMIGVPLVSIDLASVVSSFLGTSGRNIRNALTYATSGPCVLLLDEFDALAKRRDDESDIGELKRIVNVILLELDRWPANSLLVAATNHPQLLDEAVYRRFDHHLIIGLPRGEERLSILHHLALGSAAEQDAALDVVAEVTEDWSGSDLERTWEIALRRSTLNRTDIVGELLAATAAKVGGKGERDRFWALLSDRLNLSNRHIAAIAGVSHPTVSAALTRARSRS